LNVHQVAPRQPILLATSTIDVAVARSRKQGFPSYSARRWSATELAAALARCLGCGV